MALCQYSHDCHENHLFIILSLHQMNNRDISQINIIISESKQKITLIHHQLGNLKPTNTTYTKDGYYLLVDGHQERNDGGEKRGQEPVSLLNSSR